MTREELAAYYGVTLSIDAARSVLESAPIREVKHSEWYGEYNGIEIEYDGQWMGLSRTDLKDDVCTGLVATKTPEEWRAHYLKGVNYGARIGVRGGGRTLFAVIDAFSDG